MLEKLVVLLLIVLLLLPATACHDNTYFDKETIDNLDIEEELQKLEDIRQFYIDTFGIDLFALDQITDDAVNNQPQEIKYGFVPFPVELYSVDVSGTNPLTGKRFYVEGNVGEIITGSYEGVDFEYVDIIVFIEETESWFFMSLDLTDFVDIDSFRELTYEFIRFYFEYVGYSAIAWSQYGILIDFDIVTP